MQDRVDEQDAPTPERKRAIQFGSAALLDIALGLGQIIVSGSPWGPIVFGLLLAGIAVAYLITTWATASRMIKGLAFGASLLGLTGVIAGGYHTFVPSTLKPSGSSAEATTAAATPPKSTPVGSTNLSPSASASATPSLATTSTPAYPSTPVPPSGIPPPLTTCPASFPAEVAISSGGQDFDIDVRVCSPPPAQAHYWLMAVLPHQGASNTTNYYPLGDVETDLQSVGRDTWKFPSHVNDPTIDRCYGVFTSPDSLQTTLEQKSSLSPRGYLYTTQSRPPDGLKAASDCVRE